MSIGFFYFYARTMFRDSLIKQISFEQIRNGNKSESDFSKYIEELDSIVKIRAIKRVETFVYIMLVITVFIPMLAFLSIILGFMPI
jgi:hypothetical protein